MPASRPPPWMAAFSHGLTPGCVPGVPVAGAVPGAAAVPVPVVEEPPLPPPMAPATAGAAPSASFVQSTPPPPALPSCPLTRLFQPPGAAMFVTPGTAEAICPAPPGAVCANPLAAAVARFEMLGASFAAVVVAGAPELLVEVGSAPRPAPSAAPAAPPPDASPWAAPRPAFAMVLPTPLPPGSAPPAAPSSAPLTPPPESAPCAAPMPALVSAPAELPPGIAPVAAPSSAPFRPPPSASPEAAPAPAPMSARVAPPVNGAAMIGAARSAHLPRVPQKPIVCSSVRDAGVRDRRGAYRHAAEHHDGRVRVRVVGRRGGAHHTGGVVDDAVGVLAHRLAVGALRVEEQRPRPAVDRRIARARVAGLVQVPHDPVQQLVP